MPYHSMPYHDISSHYITYHHMILLSHVAAYRNTQHGILSILEAFLLEHHSSSKRLAPGFAFWMSFTASARTGCSFLWCCFRSLSLNTLVELARHSCVSDSTSDVYTSSPLKALPYRLLQGNHLFLPYCLLQGSQSSFPLSPTGPYRSEGTTLAIGLAASLDYT